ncbi:hypothetical protein LSH36_722g00000 [Paralvinella palmiformis]|uniref:N-acetyltransferase domain-containing protein n=1 Tax=Paralvinella palmiformis TaxID=53620 RepID=A0AAD9MUS0_9ANNE|nr:hypothetical protein LSH36_722g00000 [Paralvinella palmiformis]
MGNDIEMQIKIRKFTDGDIHGVMDVLTDAAFSHIWPGFLLTVKKRAFQLFSLLLPTVIYLLTWSEWIFIYTFVACYCVVYVFNLTVALVYVHGPPLTDMKCVLRNYFDNTNSCFWVAENVDVDRSMQIVGTIAIVNKNHGHYVNTEAWLRRMAVHRKFRGKGIAGRLIETAIDFCVEQNYKTICLITTEVHVQARQLYRKYGFTCTGYRPIFYLKGLVPIWTFEFEKYL